MDTSTFGPGIEILGPITADYSDILTPGAVAFVARLQRAFDARRLELLDKRAARQKQLDAGYPPYRVPVREDAAILAYRKWLEQVEVSA